MLIKYCTYFAPSSTLLLSSPPRRRRRKMAKAIDANLTTHACPGKATQLPLLWSLVTSTALKILAGECLPCWMTRWAHFERGKNYQTCSCQIWSLRKLHHYLRLSQTSVCVILPFISTRNFIMMRGITFTDGKP